MARKGIVLLILGALALVGLAAAQVFGNNRLNYSTYKSGAYSNAKAERVYEIYTEGQWQKYWMETTGNPARTAPTDIEFGREMLIAVHLGERRTGGYQIVVKDIQRVRPNEVVISLVEYTPSPDMLVPQVITSPYAIIRVPHIVGTISYSRSKEIMPRGGIDNRPNRPRPRTCDCTCDHCRRGYCEDDLERERERDRDRQRRNRDRSEDEATGD